jgi:hypothetical protein
MSSSEIEVPKTVLPFEKVELILGKWEKKRRGLLGPLLFPDSCGRRLVGIEKVYIPHYLFTFHQSTKSGTEVHYILIDAVCGFGAYTNVEPGLRKETPEDRILPTLIPQGKAQEKAKEWLTRWNLRKHVFHLIAPELLSSRAAIFYLPFWVAYYRRPSGKVDVEAVDGVQGYMEGARTKYLIKMGMDILKSSDAAMASSEDRSASVS